MSLTTIVIRTKNEEETIGDCLDALVNQHDNNTFEILVIDSGSTDGTLYISKSFPVRVIEINNFSFGGALNLGARTSNNPYIINLSAHCTPVNRNWYRNYVDFMKQNPNFIAAFGRHIPIRGKNPFEEVETEEYFWENNSKIIFSNSNCIIRRSSILKQPFDEDLPFAEDYVWARLQMMKGKEIKYLPQCGVYHSHPFDLKYFRNRMYKNGAVTRIIPIKYGFDYYIRGDDISKNGISAKTMHQLIQRCTGLFRMRYFIHSMMYPLYYFLQNQWIREGYMRSLPDWHNQQLNM